jgi:hypothetical protein
MTAIAERESYSVSGTTIQMLQAASELLGGPKALAEHLEISETMLGLYMKDRTPLPDALLLRTVDIILAHRATRLPGGSMLATGSALDGSINGS